ncbi:MAG: rod shape-determining protein RodA [Oscillospiraceae bacterium]|nr:rod shape-determining protein RodA [Oscillospiraceae bacterium]
MSGFWKSFRNFFRQIDAKLLFVALFASTFGMVLITSATQSMGSGSFIKVQLVATLAGVFLYLILSWLDLDSASSWWKYVYIANLLLICSLIFFGTGAEETGNRAWIRFGSVGIQPAELGKVLFIVAFAGHISSLDDRLDSPFTVILLGIHALIPIALIYFISSDLGSALVYVIIFIVMMFCAGIKLRWFVGAGIALGAASPLIWKFFLRNDQKMRVLVVFNPELDPLGRGYHAIQSKIAIGSGQLFGRGLGQGTQTQLGYLPAKQTDFIFSVAGEELGFIGCIAIIVILAIIIARCISITMRSSSFSSYLICAGVSAMLIAQTIENIGMCTGLMPVIGLTLPLFSYGGSSVLAVYMALGLISSARMRAVPSRLSN